MHTSSLSTPRTSTRPARASLLSRLAAIWLKPSQRDLDLALLRDIDAPEVLRAQAELREAWRRWLPIESHFRDS
jgi:hypothetical protein